MKLKTNFKERRSLGQDVFEYLKNAIIEQAIKPAERLVETRIADMLGISRTPLREALHKLEREGWIEKPPSGGYMVVTLAKEDIEQAFAIRSVLEAYAARLAAEKHKEKDLVPLEKKMKEFQDCLETDDKDKLHRINTEFHELLYGLSDSPRLIKMINQLREQVSMFRRIILKQDSFVHESKDDHIKILSLIRARDGEGVERLVRLYIDKGKKVALSQLVKEEKSA